VLTTIKIIKIKYLFSVNNYRKIISKLIKLNRCFLSFDLGLLKLSYNELGYNEHSVITNKQFGPKCPFTTQIDPVITNPGYNGLQLIPGVEVLLLSRKDR